MMLTAFLFIELGLLESPASATILPGGRFTHTFISGLISKEVFDHFFSALRRSIKT